MITIHDFPGGARGLRSAWLCEELGLEHAFSPVGFPPSAEYRALNPFGTVPFLQDGEVAISESIAMLLYVAQHYGPTDLLPAAGDPRHAKVLQYTLLGEASFSAPMTPLIATRFGAPEDEKRNWLVTITEHRLRGVLNLLAETIGDRAFLVGDSLTLADISIATGLGIWIGAVGQEIPERLQVYLDRLKERPAYQRAKASHGAGPQ